MTSNNQRNNASFEYRKYIATKNYRASTVPLVTHESNRDEEKHKSTFLMNFTKGLKHDKDTGLVSKTSDYEDFRDAILGGYIEPFHAIDVSFPPGKRRLWEAPTAGFVFDTQGPDGQAVTMAPAPELGSDELTFEMGEVYELSYLRDLAFGKFNCKNKMFKESLTFLQSLAFTKSTNPARPRSRDGLVNLSESNLFRGSSPKVEDGPYLSCFMVMGGGKKERNITSGEIIFGAQSIDQRVPVAKSKNFMTNFNEFLSVQNGEKTSNNPITDPEFYTGEKQFIETPRDLATYVHFDALYQAYLNACLILLSQKGKEGLAPYDPSFNRLSGEFSEATAGGFALYGGPHILSLVTEVATRALKAVRYQKFQVHRRCRPEAIGGLLNRVNAKNTKFKSKINKSADNSLSKMLQDLDGVLKRIEKQEGKSYDFGLLPMAFREGSPMHPAYGAGHATVAGACVTVLKAFFDTSSVLQKVEGVIGFAKAGTGENVKIITKPCDKKSDTYTTNKISVEPSDVPLTLEGELNKLAANISIGRNMGGVHYFSDYYDSVRMGEEIAIGILKDQAEGYPFDEFELSLNTFDGKAITIGRT